MARRVVVTGTGMITPVGLSTSETWANLLAGKSGAAPITKFDPSRLQVRFACEVKGFDPLAYLEKKEAKRKMGTRLQRRGIRHQRICMPPRIPQNVKTVITALIFESKGRRRSSLAGKPPLARTTPRLVMMV